MERCPQAIRGPVGEGGDDVNIVHFITNQRNKHAVPHAFTCRVLEVSASWFYKWVKDPTTARAKRRAELDEGRVP